MVHEVEKEGVRHMDGVATQTGCRATSMAASTSFSDEKGCDVSFAVTANRTLHTAAASEAVRLSCRWAWPRDDWVRQG